MSTSFIFESRNNKRQKTSLNMKILTRDLLIQIFQYLPLEYLKIFMYGYKLQNLFQWIESNEQLARIALMDKCVSSYRINLMYSDKVLNVLMNFKETQLYQLYTFCTVFEGYRFQYINIFSNEGLFKKRPHNLKKLVFDIFEDQDVNGPSISRPRTPVKSINHFIENMNEIFYFYVWEKHISFQYAVIAGGSVLNCAINEHFDPINQDIDIFYFGNSFYQFVNETFEKLSKNFYILKPKPDEKIINRYPHMTVYTYCMLIFDKKITLQFINDQNLLQKNLLNRFDISCCQVCYDPSKQVVSATPAFIESINTGCFINYEMSYATGQNSMQRNLKYVNRGFTHLVHKSFDKYKNVIDDRFGKKTKTELYVDIFNICSPYEEIINMRTGKDDKKLQKYQKKKKVDNSDDDDDDN